VCGDLGRLGELYLPAVVEQCRHPSSFGDGDHRLLGLHRKALSRAMAGASLVGGDRAVGYEMDVGLEDRRPSVVEHDPAVHLGQL
jgi:hypothetical protein